MSDTTDMTTANDLDRLRAFVRDQVAPLARGWDEDERMPREHVQRLAGAGLLGQTLSRDAGGAGRSPLDAARTIAEVARGCAVSARVLVDTNFGAVQIIDRWATDEIRTRYLPGVRSGEKLVAIAITEPGAGSAANELTTSATFDRDEVVLTGSKRWITGAGERDLYLVFARFDDVPGAAGVGAVLVPAGTPGLRIGNREPTMGLRGLREGELHFEGCRVPDSHLIVEPGPGAFGRLMAAYNGQRVGAASVSLGLGRGALDIAVDYAKERHQFGKPIAEYQAIQLMLADMAIQLDAAELLIERAATTLDRHGFPARYETSVAKTFASEAGILATNTAIQILGGNGYSRHYQVERMARDARMFTIGGGTSQMQRLAVAATLLAE
ncbi:MAG TPA: acyl-CoA dehydrogenase family protein [Thermomicrobiales bacterium]|nr:acyl-CoA dehydrogenase family protein [Thermomicrobiales bacterium]